MNGVTIWNFEMVMIERSGMREDQKSGMGGDINGDTEVGGTDDNSNIRALDVRGHAEGAHHFNGDIQTCLWKSEKEREKGG
mmetsp:Transcript_10956/g.30735  ORF Transcript_10956/g.30735 Transcript_10956/m.30735 type:complete len:81 (+) Transcript_10956:49-291(+)